MLIFPAIDLMGGQAVRLEKGARDSRRIVGTPLELVDKFERAPLIHVVDLDGAFAGSIQQWALIEQLAARHAIQVGGGVRSADDLKRLFDADVNRVVLGTAAMRDPGLLAHAIKSWGAARIVVALDVKDGAVAVAGWVEKIDVRPSAAAKSLADLGVRNILCTAVHRDGMLEGPDVAILNEMRFADARLSIIASGGVSSLDDLRTLRENKMAAAIVGKALYAGRFTLDEALSC